MYQGFFREISFCMCFPFFSRLSLIFFLRSCSLFIPQDIKRHDQGVYRCRVDFRTTQTQSYTYNLSVISEYMHVCWKAHMSFDFISVLGMKKQQKRKREATEKKQKSITLYFILFTFGESLV